MLRALVFLHFLFFFNSLLAFCPQKNTCPAHTQEDFLNSNKILQSDKELQSFLADSLRQRDKVLREPEFQDFVTAVQAQTKLEATSQEVKSYKSGELYIFVSFSLGEKALLNLAQEAKAYNSTLVLRGFKACPHGSGEPGKASYIKTVQALQKVILKTGQGLIIDPELFSLFSVSVVPTFILSKSFQFQADERNLTPLHDRLQGHVSARYALETFAQSGDLQEEANSLLARASLEKGNPK